MYLYNKLKKYKIQSSEKIIQKKRESAYRK